MNEILTGKPINFSAFISPLTTFTHSSRMNIKDLVVVTGIPGIQRIAASRNNGMMVEDLDSGKVHFASIRKHQFSPLESISIYTDDSDAVELKAVLQSMLDNLEETPPVPPNSKPEDLRMYFSKILPNYDRDQVHVSDIKKLIRWFHFLNERGFLTAAADEEE